MQSTSQLLMIRPIRFGFNTQTAMSNAFQDSSQSDIPEAITQQNALAEFDLMVKQLRSLGVEITVIEDSPEPHTPDAIFPNNWVSFHDNGTVILYPMQAKNRRLERRNDIIEQLENRFYVNQTIDLSYFEAEDKFLEGTGSMVLDRQNKVAYACVSPRTNRDVLAVFGQKMNYKIIAFEAHDNAHKQIYHTNVLMCIGEMFAVICLDAITSLNEKQLVRQSLETSGKRIVEISHAQMNRFAGNMLQIKTKADTKLLVMSSQAFDSLEVSQKRILGEYCTIIHSNLQTIETNGGGSARCMMAEIHLPQK